MNKTDEFLELYNDLDYLLRQKYNDNARTNSVIMRLSNELTRSGNSHLIKMGKKLNMIRMLRNNIIHDYDNNVDSFIEISDEAIAYLKSIITMIKNPRTAKDLYTPLKNLYAVKYQDDVLVYQVMEEMRKRGFSQVPILGKFNMVKGVFSPNVLFSYMEKNHNVDLMTLTFKDLVDYIPVNAHFSETYAFIKSNESETDIDNLFLSSYEHNKKLAVAFVTEHGKENEPLLGIVVLKDILKN